MREKIICFFIILLIILLTMCVGLSAYSKDDYKNSNTWKNATIISGSGNEKFNTIQNNYRRDVNNVGMTVMSDDNDVLRSYHGYCVDGNCESVRGRNYRKFEIF